MQIFGNFLFVQVYFSVADTEGVCHALDAMNTFVLQHLVSSSNACEKFGTLLKYLEIDLLAAEQSRVLRENSSVMSSVFLDKN